MEEIYRLDIVHTITQILKEEILLDSIEDIGITKVEVIGSRTCNKYKENSDLDILVEYENDIKECYVHNMLNLLGFEFDGMKIDFFPKQVRLKSDV